MKNLIIYGSGGLGEEVLALVNNINDLKPKWNFLGFIDDNYRESDLGNFEYLNQIQDEVHLIIAVGDPLSKRKMAKNVSHLSNIKWATLIHPQSFIMNKESIKVGEGSIIGAGAVLTTGITVGNHVLLNLNATIGHGAIIGDFCSIMPGVNLAGDVTIGSEVLIGSGANVLNGIRIGNKSKVGSGAVVTKHVSDNTCVIGIPAKEL